jgi:hypothetical protein
MPRYWLEMRQARVVIETWGAWISVEAADKSAAWDALEATTQEARHLAAEDSADYTGDCDVDEYGPWLFEDTTIFEGEAPPWEQGH